MSGAVAFGVGFMNATSSAVMPPVNPETLVRLLLWS
jgi:hypothetical protein